MDEARRCLFCGTRDDWHLPHCPHHRPKPRRPKTDPPPPPVQLSTRQRTDAALEALAEALRQVAALARARPDEAELRYVSVLVGEARRKLEEVRNSRSA
jgi:hypothetical protein